MIARPIFAACIAAGVAVPAFAGPLSVTTAMLVERRIAAADGTTRVALVAPDRVVPGDRVVMVLTYRNTGATPIADLVLANPVPKGLSYRAANPGTPPPDLSVDGKTFGPLSTLRVALPGGATRAAGLDDVTGLRWRLANPVTPGAQGQLAVQAVLK